MMTDKMAQREITEWSNTWIEEATDLSKKRILLIGDSVAREFRSYISKLLPNYAFAYKVCFRFILLNSDKGEAI